MNGIVSCNRMIIELNPRYWVGQVVKTTETIRKTDYLYYLHYLLDYPL